MITLSIAALQANTKNKYQALEAKLKAVLEENIEAVSEDEALGIEPADLGIEKEYIPYGFADYLRKRSDLKDRIVKLVYMKRPTKNNTFTNEVKAIFVK